MSQFFEKVFHVFHKLNILYILGADSLVAFAQGDLFKYSHHLKLYLLPLGPFKYFQLFLVLLFNRIVLKPKIVRGRLYLKLRFKENLFTKDSTYVSISLAKQAENGLSVFLGGHDSLYSDDDLNQNSIQYVEMDGEKIAVPSNMDAFVEKYRRELMSGFYMKHEVEFDSESEKSAVQFMHDNIAVMKDAGIHFWIEGGTLLGALRDQKLIPWDHDLDFGMIFESQEQMKQLIRALRRHFYVSVRGFPKTDTVWQLGDYRVLKIFPRKFLFFKEKLCLDLFVYYKGNIPDSPEPVYKYVVWDRNAFHRTEFLESTESINFYGGNVPVPANPEKFIEVKYGEGWRTPVKEWNVALDDGSIYRPD